MTYATAPRTMREFEDAYLHQAPDASRRVVSSNPPRAVAFWRCPIGPAAYQWTLAFGWRPDLAKPFDMVPVRLALQVTRRWPYPYRYVTPDGVRVERSPLAGGWSIRLRSDWRLIEERIAYRWIGRHLVNRLVKGRVTPSALRAEEARLEGLAWRTESQVQAQVALRGVEALRGVMAEHGWPDRHGRTHWRGFFG